MNTNEDQKKRMGTETMRISVLLQTAVAYSEDAIAERLAHQTVEKLPCSMFLFLQAAAHAREVVNQNSCSKPLHTLSLTHMHTDARKWINANRDKPDSLDHPNRR